MIWAKNIDKHFGDLHVLKRVDLEVKRGEIVSIVGPSGAGKTTLLHILGTLDRPDYFPNTEIRIAGQSVRSLSEKDLAKFRNKNIGFVFQFHQLLPEFTALENVCIPAFIAGKTKVKSKKRATELLTLLGLKNRIQHKPKELSGGEQQRVAVARALINKPGLILADEPTGNLDSESAEQLHRIFFELRNQTGVSIVLVTHNSELANLADRKLTMVDGSFLIHNLKK